MKKKTILLTAALLLGGAMTSCDNYLDINVDPNSPTEKDITPDMLMPAAEMNLCAGYGDFLRIVGGYFSQHYAQIFGTSNFLDFSSFTMSATRSSGTYSQLTYGVQKSLKTILDKSAASEDWGTYLAATTLRAYTYQVLVDCYGEIPYSEALNPANPMPHYDQGADIYAGLIQEIDNALSKAKASDPVATNFLYAGETAEPWIKFAKAVKFKILMRESGAGIDGVDAQLDALVAEGDFPTSDVEFAGIWKNEPGQMNPFYSEEFASNWGSTQQNVIANIAIIGTMQQKDAEGNTTYDDPRLPKFFATNGSGQYTGGISGSNFSTTNSFKTGYWCRPVATYDMPVILYSQTEHEFFLAEYYAKKGNATDAAAHYSAAIEASFSMAGVDGAADYVARFPLDMANYKKSIGVAKWTALAGFNNFESWCEMRRLDYPAFGTVSGTDLYDNQNDASYAPGKYVAGTLYTPIQVYGPVGANHILERMPYAESSSSRNSNTPEFPGYTSPVFWAK